uniref:Uncharacterized protein n=1 Tax=Parascaris univalens TaxID=6257 RepID=A0A915C895_PARUN
MTWNICDHLMHRNLYQCKLIERTCRHCYHKQMIEIIRLYSVRMENKQRRGLHQSVQ